MSSRKSKLLPIGIAMVGLIAIAIYFKFNRTEPDKTEGIILSKKSPPVLGLLPEFELTDQALETFGSVNYVAKLGSQILFLHGARLPALPRRRK
jgi:hypothetical protein